MSDSPDHERDDEGPIRARWESTQAAVRDRLDEPIAKATQITKKTLAWFPVRVWRHFLQNNGFLLAAGVSYQALFAVFAAVYVAFTIVGLWLGASDDAVHGLIDIVNQYLPGFIAQEGGVVSTADVERIATGNVGVLTATGGVALVALVWTAIGWVTFSRRAVRDIFGLPPDRRPYLLLKVRDLFAAALLGAALMLGSFANSVGVWSLDLLFGLFGWSTESPAFNFGVRFASLIVSFALNTGALGSLVRFLTGATLPWRRIWPGALLGGAAVTVLQAGAGLLVSYSPSNALLATFAVFIGLLLWFRLVSVVILVAAAWIAVAAADLDVPLVEPTEQERRAAEHEADIAAAAARLREAVAAAVAAPWYRRNAARRAVREAQAELTRLEGADAGATVGDEARSAHAGGRGDVGGRG